MAPCRSRLPRYLRWESGVPDLVGTCLDECPSEPGLERVSGRPDLTVAGITGVRGCRDARLSGDVTVRRAAFGPRRADAARFYSIASPPRSAAGAGVPSLVRRRGQRQRYRPRPVCGCSHPPLSSLLRSRTKVSSPSTFKRRPSRLQIEGR